MKNFIIDLGGILFLLAILVYFFSNRNSNKKCAENYIQKAFQKIQKEKGVEKANLFLKELYVASKNNLTKDYWEYKISFLKRKNLIDYIELSIQEIVDGKKITLSKNEEDKILERLNENLIQ